uniref:65-kDa microtubule-associated protein 8 n=1 Tax=Noccaea caerulescens TaxID=107243 RepID=A0A1J3H8S0_NOCCA
MKKIIPQTVAEQDNFYTARPVTSNRRISNRSINGGRGFNDTHYAALGTSLRTSKKHGLKHSLASHHRDETASVISLFSGPLSP